MKFIDIMKASRAQGVLTDAKLWKAFELISEDLGEVAELRPELYLRIMRHQHAAIYNKHYTEDFANYDVNRLVYEDRAGEGCKSRTVQGPHWSKSEVEELTEGLLFFGKVNSWDKYVALNTSYATLCLTCTDEEIVKVAHTFWFMDKNWQSDGDCTKIWDYQCTLIS